MKRKIAWIMAALLTVSSVEPATVLSVSAQEVTEADGWTADEGLAEAEDNESAENFTDAEATEDVGDIVAEDGFTSETGDAAYKKRYDKFFEKVQFKGIAQD